MVCMRWPTNPATERRTPGFPRARAHFHTGREQGTVVSHGSPSRVAQPQPMAHNGKLPPHTCSSSLPRARAAALNC